MILISENWRSSHPGAAAAFMAMRNTEQHPRSAPFEAKRAELEKQLRERYHGMNRKDLLQIPEFAAYSTYYKQFKKTYHLLLQIESITQKNKSIPKTVPLVQAMFMAESNNLLLTAGHDLDQIQGQIKLDSAQGDEVYALLRGEEVTCKPGDMVTADFQGVFCSIIYGQDFRTQITSGTHNVLYVIYVPPGIETERIEFHLQDLETNVRLAFPNAQTTFREVFCAPPASSFL
jgi:DNA/RNA-binding domain of Phe-tRNA-synthetase-like protein